MKFYCINYQSIIDGQRTNAAAKWMFDMFRQLDGQRYIYLASHIRGYEGENLHCMSKNQWIIYRIVEIITGKLRIPYYIRRTWLEKVVDWSLCGILKKEKEPFLLITTMYAVKCTTYAKKRGCKVLLFAGNLNDNLYYKIVKKEQKRLGLHYTDVFCSEYRIKVYNRMFDNIDYVWCLNSLSAWSFDSKKTILDPRTIKRVKILHPKQYDSVLPDKIKIGYFGHTTLLKGVHQLPEAASVCRHKDDIEFIIAGNVDNYVKEVIDKYTNIKVTFLGPVKESEKWNVIQRFDFMIVPSLYDAGPMTITEAYLCDVPVIVSSGCGGVERVKDDPKCIIFETMNIQDLANKLDYAYEHRADYLYASNIDELDCQSSSMANKYIFFTKIIESL